MPLGGFKARFRCYAASAVGRKDLDGTGKVLLPQACLAALLSSLGGMPPTLLLRLSHGTSKLYVGVAEFIDDAAAGAFCGAFCVHSVLPHRSNAGRARLSAVSPMGAGLSALSM